MSVAGFVSSKPDGVVLTIKLQPKASSNEICGVQGGELRVKVTAPPVDGAANDALIRLLADALDCPRNQVQLMRGQTSRHKIVKLHGISESVVLKKLSGIL